MAALETLTKESIEGHILHNGRILRGTSSQMNEGITGDMVRDILKKSQARHPGGHQGTAVKEPTSQEVAKKRIRKRLGAGGWDGA